MFRRSAPALDIVLHLDDPRYKQPDEPYEQKGQQDEQHPAEDYPYRNLNYHFFRRLDSRC